MPDSSKRKRHLVQARVSPAEFAAWTAKAAAGGRVVVGPVAPSHDPHRRLDPDSGRRRT